MQLIASDNLDKKKWDAMVLKHEPAAFFSFSWYLDAVAQNWSVLVDKKFEKGIAFATKKQGVFTTIYTPNFSRYCQFIGDFDKQDMQQFGSILAKFSNIDMHFNVQFLEGEMKEKMFQKAAALDLKAHVSSQAQKGYKKAILKGYSIKHTWDKEKFYSLLVSELGSKDVHYQSHNLKPLKELIAKAMIENKLVIFGIYDQQVFVGACLAIQQPTAMLYLKGISTEEAKLNGAMHLVFKYFQDFCIQNELDLDFGGSNIAGIRQFFVNYGGKDVTYYSLNKSTRGFRFFKKINAWIRKK